MQRTDYFCIDPGFREFHFVNLQLCQEPYNTKENECFKVEKIDSVNVFVANLREVLEFGNNAIKLLAGNRKFLYKHKELPYDYVAKPKILIEDQKTGKRNNTCLSYAYFLAGFLKNNFDVELVAPSTYKKYFSASTGSYYQNKKRALQIAKLYTDEELTHHEADCLLMAIYYYEQKEKNIFATKEDSETEMESEEYLVIDEDTNEEDDF